MVKYITQIDVSLDDNEESQLRAQGFRKDEVDLNEGAGGKNIHLWYKQEEGQGISRIQFSFTDDMEKGLYDAGYKKINKNLNASAGGDTIYLWYQVKTSEYDVPIKDLHVSDNVEDEAQRIKFGWERMACNLNRRAGGKKLHLMVQREKPTFICDLDATSDWIADVSFFQNGFHRMDEDLNRFVGSEWIYLWTRQKTDKKMAITDLQVSLNDNEYDNFQQQGYKPVNKNLNEGAGGDPVFLWYKNDGNDPIKGVTVIYEEEAVVPFQSVGVQVIKKNLNSGNSGPNLYMCFYR